MNRSLKDLGLALMVVSQFTLLGDCSKGRRPSFTRAAPPDIAKRLYNHFIEKRGHLTFQLPAENSRR